MAPPILKMEIKMGGLQVEKKNRVRHNIYIHDQEKTPQKKKTHHAMGKVTNNDII
jgi:hypothetical protein